MVVLFVLWLSLVTDDGHHSMSETSAMQENMTMRLKLKYFLFTNN
jgi:hypothetical protein